MSRAERDPRLAKQLMERAVSPSSLEHIPRDDEGTRLDRVLGPKRGNVNPELESITAFCKRVCG